MIKSRLHLLIAITILCISSLSGQVQVSQEPMHHLVLENQYIRVLDVWLQPKDTTAFHIHSTPSLFLYYSNTLIGTQIQSQEWVREQSVAGKTWYRSFSPDILIHRVSNLDTIPLHVMDVEILSFFTPSPQEQIPPLPFTVLFENERSFAYQLVQHDMQKEIVSRGPLIAQLVSGNEVIYNNLKTKEFITINPGQFFYIETGTSFYLTKNGSDEINMVLFEIK